MLIEYLRNTDIRNFLRTKKQLNDEIEKTEYCEKCDRPNTGPYINCGKDCVYHKDRDDEMHKIDKNLKPCRCTNKEKAGMIENRIYCSFKKRRYETNINIEDIEF